MLKENLGVALAQFRHITMATARRLELRERIHLIKRYYETSHSFTRINDEWQVHFQTEAPSKSSIQTLVVKFEASGCVTDAKRSGAPKDVRTIQNSDLVALPQRLRKALRNRNAELHLNSTFQEVLYREL